MNRLFLGMSATVLLAAGACGGSAAVVISDDAGVENDATDNSADSATGDSGADAASDTSTTDGAKRDANNGLFNIEVNSVDIMGNCMPVVAEDPWTIGFRGVYDNRSSNAAVATFVSVTLTFQNNQTLNLTMSPAQSGNVAAGAKIQVMHTKTASTPNLFNDCNHCGRTALLTATYTVGGPAPIVVTVPNVPISCVF